MNGDAVSEVRQRGEIKWGEESTCWQRKEDTEQERVNARVGRSKNE